MIASRASAALIAWVLVGAALRVGRVLEHPFLHADAPALLAIARDTLGGPHPLHALAGYYPPLYPAAIRAVHWLGVDWEAAGRTVSCLAGILTVIATGALGSMLFGNAAGVTAAALAALHPSLIHASAEVLAESLHGLFVITWALLVLPATGLGAARLVGAGTLAAMASLVRAEGIVLVPFTALAAAWGAPVGSRRHRVILALAAAAVVLVPVLATIYTLTGQIVVSGKEGPAILRRYGVPAGGIVTLITAYPAAWLRVYPHALGRQVWLTGGAIHGILLPPLLIGLVGAAPIARRAVGLVVMVLAASVVGIPLIAPGRRYVTPLVPLLLPFVAEGTLAIVQAAGRRGVPQWVTATALAAVAIGLGAQGLGSPEREEERCYQEVCKVATAGLGTPLPALVADDSRIAWVCGARFVLRPRGLIGAPLVAFAQRRHAGLAVLPARDAAPPLEGAAVLGTACAGPHPLAVLAVR